MLAQRTQYIEIVSMYTLSVTNEANVYWWSMSHFPIFLTSYLGTVQHLPTVNDIQRMQTSTLSCCRKVSTVLFWLSAHNFGNFVHRESHWNKFSFESRWILKQTVFLAMTHNWTLGQNGTVLQVLIHPTCAQLKINIQQRSLVSILIDQISHLHTGYNIQIMEMNPISLCWVVWAVGNQGAKTNIICLTLIEVVCVNGNWLNKTFTYFK
jgi:hypothetical protein